MTTSPVTPHSELDRLKNRRRMLLALPLAAVVFVWLLYPVWQNRWIMQLNTACEAFEAAGEDPVRLAPVIAEFDRIGQAREAAGQPFAWITFLRGGARFRAADYASARGLLDQTLRELAANAWMDDAPASRESVERQSKLLLCAIRAEEIPAMPPAPERNAALEELLKAVGEVQRLIGEAAAKPAETRLPGDTPEELSRERALLDGIVFRCSERLNAGDGLNPDDVHMGPAPSPIGPERP